MQKKSSPLAFFVFAMIYKGLKKKEEPLNILNNNKICFYSWGSEAAEAKGRIAYEAKLNGAYNKGQILLPLKWKAKLL